MDYYESNSAFEFPEMKHSGLGIASFVIAVTVGLLEFVLLAIAGVLEVTTPGGIDENSPVAVVLGLTLLAGLLVNILGIGLGIAGLCESYRKKLFAVLGVVIGAVVLFGVLLVMAIGLA